MPMALAMLPDEDEGPQDVVEIRLCRAVPALAVLCAASPLDGGAIDRYADRMNAYFSGRPAGDEIRDAVDAAYRLPAEELPFFVNYLFRTTRPFLDDAGALGALREVVALASRKVSDAGWQVLLQYGMPWFLTKEDLLGGS